MVKFKINSNGDSQIRELQEIMQYIEDNPFLKEQIPEYYPALEQAFKNIPPYVIANYIEKLPAQFNEEKNSIANMLPAIRTKEIESWLSIINFFLSENLMFNTYIKRAIKNVKAELIEIKVYLENISPKSKKQYTYKWLSNPEKELPKLYNLMNRKYIADIDYKDFRAIFSDQPIDSIKHKLKWISEPVLLAYFIYHIKELGKISKLKFVIKAKYCFENAESLKQSSYNYQNNKTGLPKDYYLIENLLKDL